MNSRSYGGTGDLGLGGGWSHSYSWKIPSTDPVQGTVPATPSSYQVLFPDGRTELFSYSSTDTYWRGAIGLKERFQPLDSSLYCYLLLPDGGQVQFKATKQTYQDDITGTELWYSYYSFQAVAIIDPNGLPIVLTYESSSPTAQLTQVTEPAGRWLKIYYVPGSNYPKLIDHVSAGYGGVVTQTATYSYGTLNYYSVLAGTSYSDGTSASYTYQASNTSSAGYPLILTCQDVRYPGPMSNIRYAFKPAGFYGQLYQEQTFGGAMVTQLDIAGSTRTETRGDGPSRIFTYGGTANGVSIHYLLKSVSDFVSPSIITSYAYDARGFLNKIVDADHKSTDGDAHVTYLTNLASTGVVTQLTHGSDSSSINYTYDSSGYYLKTKSDELNHKTTYMLNPDMTAYEIDYPDSGIEKFTYNGFAQVLTHTMVSNTGTAGSGGTETFTYDSRGMLTSSYPPATPSDANPAAHPTRYTYDAYDHPHTITDPRGNVTTLTYNQRGQLNVLQNPDADQSQTVNIYNDDGTLKSTSTDYALNTAATTSFIYDAYKRLQSVTDPLSHKTSFWYAHDGTATNDYSHTDANVTRTVLPSTHVNVTQYDNNHRINVSTIGYGTADAAATLYWLDNVGNLIGKWEPKYNGQNGGYHWSYSYDARNRLQYVDDPVGDKNADNHSISYTYDVAGNKKSERRANDQVITYDSYDAMNRLLQMTVGQAPTLPAVTLYSWTKAGKIASMNDPRNYVYSYAYDAQNRLTTTTYPSGGGTETKSYDFAGNLATFKNRGGASQTFTYDTRNREKTYSWNDGITPSCTLTYDDASRITSSVTPKTNINFTYYNDNRLKSQEEWTGYFGDNVHRTMSYTYDPDGNRETTALPGVSSIKYTYTARDQLDTVVNNGNGAVLMNYGYDANGNVISRAPNNGTTSTYTCDALNRITNIQHSLSGTTRMMNYGYDAVSNRTYVQRVTDGQGQGADGFGYDKNNQLTSFQFKGTLSGSGNNGTVNGGATTSLTYDKSGDRMTLTANGATTTYGTNNLNEYTSMTGRPAPSYTASGNLATWTDSQGNDWTYSYDAMNRLTKASGDGQTILYYYDGLNRQIARNIDGVGTFLSVWDGWNLYAEFQYAAAGDTLYKSYCRGAGGELVKEFTGGVYYYEDALGSTSQVADQAGGLLESYTYDAYGYPTFYTPGGVVLPDGTAHRVDQLFAGQRWDDGVQLYDNRNRFYAPDLGRFLQPDPIGFGGDPANLYRYCGNNPANGSDPNGLDTYIGYRHIGSPDAVPFWSNNWLTAHEFIYTTNSDGQLAHIYTWGTNGWNGRWERDPQYDKNLTAAANSLIASNNGEWQGDSNFDAYVQASFDQFSQHPSHWNWGVCNNCQTEAGSLLNNARAIQTQQMNSRFAGYNPAIFNVGMVPGLSYNVNGALFEGYYNGLPVFRPQVADGSGNTGPGLGDVGYGSAGVGSGYVVLGVGGGWSPLETKTLERMH